MKFGKRKIKIGKLNIGKRPVFIAALIVLTLIVGISGATLAKYYAKRDNKGVSVASGLYFNSNCLSNVEKGSINTSLDEIDLQTVPGYVNPEGGSTFYLEIRNFDNHLLYNELYLDVEYTIEFIKVNGETASLEYEDENGTEKQINLSDGKVFKLEKRKIAGGAARLDSYVVKVSDAKDGSDGKVLIRAYPTAPNYVAVAAENMKLLGVLTAQPKDITFGIDKQGFGITDTDEYKNDWKKTVDKMSGLEYVIQTSADDVSTGNVKGEINITWNSIMLDVNQFDPYYMEALAEMEEDTGSDAIVSDSDGVYTTMKIRVLPYANVKVTFYKTEEFVDYFKGKPDGSIMSKDEFEKYVKATLVE